jgi:uncharacterized membrane protein YdfJ with MMPL/SSD domain
MPNSVVNGTGTAAADAIKSLRSAIKPLMKGTGLTQGTTGPAAQQLDSQQSSNRAQQIVLLATLVLILVLLLVIWPSKSWRREPASARYAAIGAALGRRPAVFAAVSGVVLAAGALGFHATFDLGSAGIAKNAESQTALKTLEKGLPPGATDPTLVLLHSSAGQPLSAAELSGYSARLKALDGVGAVAPPRLSADRATAQYTVTLSQNPDSTAAVATLKDHVRRSLAGAARGECACEEAGLKKQQVLRDLLLLGHVRDAGQQQHGMRAARGQQRRGKPQRMRDHHVVVGEAVDEHERPPQLARVGDERVVRVVLGVFAGMAEVALVVVRVVKQRVGDRGASHGRVEDVRAAQHRQGGQVAAM